MRHGVSLGDQKQPDPPVANQRASSSIEECRSQQSSADNLSLLVAADERNVGGMAE
jgi:hypothetical protein